MGVRFPSLTPPEGRLTTLDENLRQIPEPPIARHFLALLPRSVDQHDAFERVIHFGFRCSEIWIAEHLAQSLRPLARVDQHRIFLAIVWHVGIYEYPHIGRADYGRVNRSTLEKISVLFYKMLVLPREEELFRITFPSIS